MSSKWTSSLISKHVKQTHIQVLGRSYALDAMNFMKFHVADSLCHTHLCVQAAPPYEPTKKNFFFFLLTTFRMGMQTLVTFGCRTVFWFASEDDLHDVQNSYHATNCRRQMKYKNDSNSVANEKLILFFPRFFIHLMYRLDYYAVNTYEIISSLFLKVTMCLSGALALWYCCCTMLSRRKRINRIPNT